MQFVCQLLRQACWAASHVLLAIYVSWFAQASCILYHDFMRSCCIPSQAQQLLDQPDIAALRDKVLIEAVARTLGAPSQLLQCSRRTQACLQGCTVAGLLLTHHGLTSATAAAAALRYNQLEPVACVLFDLLNKHEHIPAVLADITEFVSRRNHDNRLVRSADSAT